MNEGMTPMQNGNDPIAQLIRDAGAREPVPSARFERARALVETHWQEVVAEQRRQRRRRLTGFAAAAATVVIAVGAGLLLWQPTSPAALPIATVARVSGQALVNGKPVAVGDRVSTHAAVETDAGSRLALRLDTGHSLRLDRDSRLVASAADRFDLARGAIYVDSGPRGAHGPVQIATRFGVASDLGTQFQLRLSGDTLEIGVREGLVQLARDVQVLTVAAGALRRIDAGGESAELPLAARSPWWAWVEAVSADFDIEGATLEEYLRWHARERGLELRWRDEASRQRAALIRLSGSIQGLALEEGLRSVASIAEFRYALTDTALQVTIE